MDISRLILKIKDHQIIKIGEYIKIHVYHDFDENGDKIRGVKLMIEAPRNIKIAWDKKVKSGE